MAKGSSLRGRASACGMVPGQLDSIDSSPRTNASQSCLFDPRGVQAYWLPKFGVSVLGCVEAAFCNRNAYFAAFFETRLYKIESLVGVFCTCMFFSLFHSILLEGAPARARASFNEKEKGKQKREERKTDRQIDRKED